MGLRIDNVLLDLIDKGIKIKGEKIVQASFVKGLDVINVLVTTCERREYEENEDKSWYEDSNGYVNLWIVVEGYGERSSSGIKPFLSSKGNNSDHVSINTFIKNGFRKDLII